MTGDDLDVVCCSLESWDEVWRRNQFLVSGLLRLRPQCRVLFVEPPSDIMWSIAHRRLPQGAGTGRVGESGRLWRMTPRKWLPRRLWPRVDHQLGRQVVREIKRLGFQRPVLWINDSGYAAFVAQTGWPSVYDVTDDWLLAHYPQRELDRQRRNDAAMLACASEVVVCSPALEASRGRRRSVHLIPNGVDVEHFRRPVARPADLPEGRIVLYTGTLSPGRLDVALCTELARRLAGHARFVLVGPDACPPEDTARLVESGAVLLGARPYEDMPAYLQHADVLVVPHRVIPFTESLDPIKAREIVAVGRPAVSTPVAGFRSLPLPVRVVDAEAFVTTVLDILGEAPAPPGPGPLTGAPGSWAERARAFVDVLEAAKGGPTPQVVQHVSLSDHPHAGPQ